MDGPPSGGDKAPARRLNKKPDKKGGGGGDGEGGPGRSQGKRGKRGGRNFLDEERNVNVARNPRKKGKAGKMGVAPPPPPVGPAKVTLGDTITVGELAEQLLGCAAELGWVCGFQEGTLATVVDHAFVLLLNTSRAQAQGGQIGGALHGALLDNYRKWCAQVGAT